MSVSVNLCCFGVPATVLSWILPKWMVEGKEIPQVAAEDKMKYLGVEFTPLKGPRIFSLEGRLREMIERIGTRGSDLKPEQRVAFLSTYAVPRLLHQMKYCCRPWMTTLDQLYDKDLCYLGNSPVKDIEMSNRYECLYELYNVNGENTEKVEDSKICNYV
ncbi:hypothetical protein AVEN_137526-1 [Araneus ventricosus]|uniref:Uncharacterized protein n=1 Tax=Araneus ventricosus TaxID=182803 RepID=A0A4Y2JQR1_ARAVE|nr:hypothetical protein AVEN_137526-1 [Araneus ventricosus]